jgi:colicin import membrane protein
MTTAVLGFERERTHLPSAALAACVHVLLFVVLVFGVSWQSRAPETVSVELWDLAPQARTEPPPEVRRAPEPEVKPVPKVESKPAPVPVPKKVDIAVEKEKKPAPKEAPVKLDMARQMKDQLARELETVQRERERSEVLSQFKPAAAPPAVTVDAGYANRIRQKIKPNINVPPDIVGNPEAIYDVEQLPTGEVLSAKLRKSSGNRAYDDSVERAIMKASPLPRPERADQFQRRLELKFRPND